MKDFSYTPAQQGLLHRVKEFAFREVLPGAMERDRNPELPLALFRRMGELGLAGVIVPRDFGGQGGGCIEFSIVLEIVATACAATAVVLIPQYQTEYALVKFGNEVQKRKYLPPLAKGEKLAAFGMTESTAGSDVKGIKTTAYKKDADFVLRGHKSYINNASKADVLLVLANLEKGAGVFLVEQGSPGLSIGREYKPSGLRAGIIAEIILQDCVVKQENLIGKEGEGLKLALKTLDFSRVGSASICLGITEASLKGAIEYAIKRKAFNQHIADLQAIQWMLADIATELDAARLLRDRAAWLNEQEVDSAKEAAMAKLFASEVAMRSAVKAIQVCGAYGCLEDAPFERYMRDAKMYEIAGGTSEIMRLTIARRLLKA